MTIKNRLMIISHKDTSGVKVNMELEMVFNNCPNHMECLPYMFQRFYNMVIKSSKISIVPNINLKIIEKYHSFYLGYFEVTLIVTISSIPTCRNQPSNFMLQKNLFFNFIFSQNIILLSSILHQNG